MIKKYTEAKKWLESSFNDCILLIIKDYTLKQMDIDSTWK